MKATVNTRAEWWRRVEPTVSSEQRRRHGVGTPPHDANSAVAFWGLMIFTFILLLAPQTLVPALGSFRIALVAAAVAIAAHLFHRFAHRQPLMSFTWEIRIALALFAWALVTIPLSYWPGGSISFLFGLYFKSLVIFWLLANVVGSLARFRLVAWGLSLMAVVIAAVGIGQYLSGRFMAGGMANRIVGYDAALTGNPNDLALMLNLILPCTVALILTSTGWPARVVLLGCLGLDVVAVVVTLSRAGFVTLATIFLMYVWKLRNRPERVWASAALVLALISLPLLPSGYSQRLNTIADIDGDPTGSAQGRWAGMMAAAVFVLQNPVTGAGVGQSVLAMNDTLGKQKWSDVHNVYLQYAVDLGVPGLVLFPPLLVGAIMRARSVAQRAARLRGFDELAYFAEGIEISLIAFAVAAIFHPSAYHFYFYYIAGLALALTTVYETEVKSLARGEFESPNKAGQHSTMRSPRSRWWAASP
jgi:O-antigen ligase